MFWLSQTCADEESAELYSMKRLNPAATDTFEEHLLICPPCVERVEDAQDYIAVFRAAVQLGFNAGYRA